MTYKNMVFNHLQKYGEITTKEANEEYGIMRLSAIIYALRNEGYNIDTELIHDTDRYNRDVVYGKYILREAKKDIIRRGRNK